MSEQSVLDLTLAPDLGRSDVASAEELRPLRPAVRQQADHLMRQSSRDRAYLRFLQDWRREVILLRYDRDPQKFLGRSDCVFSAQSSYLRCAVHPSGPCQGCTHFQAIESGS